MHSTEHATAEARPLVPRLLAWFDGTLPGQCVRRTVELRPFDRALALASRAFIALLPLGLVVQSLTPTANNHSFADTLIDRFALSGAGADAVRRLFATPQQVRAGTTVLGFLVLIYSVYSFARLLARLYEDAWHLPKAGIKGAARGLLWVFGVAAYVGILAPVAHAVSDDAGGAVSTGVTLLLTFGVWWLTPYALLAGRIGYRTLLPTAVLTAAAMTILGAVSAIYMPDSVTTSAERYGLAGVSFSFVSWLIGVGVTVLVCAAIGAVVGERFLLHHDIEETER